MRADRVGSLAVVAALLLTCPGFAVVQHASLNGRARGLSDADAPRVRLFLDLEDPGSRAAWRVYAAAVAGTTTRLIVHPLPLARHPRARPAAHAVMAARTLGRAPAYVRALLARPGLSEADLTAAAVAAQLNPRRFDVARHSAAVRHRVERERRAAVALGVRATPSALLVGRGVSGLPVAKTARAAVSAAVARWRACRAAAVDDCEGRFVAAGGRGAAHAFAALRGASAGAGANTRAPGQRAIFAAATGGRLGARWRVVLPKTPLSLPGSPDVIAVWFIDPSDVNATQPYAALRAAAAAGTVRLVLVPIAAVTAPLAPALLLHGALAGLPGGARAAALRRFLRRGGGSLAQLAASLGVPLADANRGAAKPKAVVALEAALRLAQRVDGRPGALFLNGRRWRPARPAAAAVASTQAAISLTDAIAEVRREAQAVGGMLASQRYAHLIADGRQRSPAEADLAPGLPRRALASLTMVSPLSHGPAGRQLDVWLLVDFRRMGARAAFFALKFGTPHRGLHLHIGSVTAPRRGLGANAALLIAARQGKGLVCAERLFGLRDPDDPRSLARVFRKIGLRPRLLTQGAKDPSVRAAVAQIRSLSAGASSTTRLYVADRQYVGPIDENRIAAALAFLATASEARP